MPAASSSSRRRLKRARSSPSQSISTEPLGEALETFCTTSGRVCTSAMSQSKQTVNPGRYSAWHCEQNIAGESLHHCLACSTLRQVIDRTTVKDNYCDCVFRSEERRVGKECRSR